MREYDRDRIMHTESIELTKKTLQAQMAVSRYQMEGLSGIELESLMDYELDRMIVRLRGHIYERQTELYVVSVPFSQSRPYATTVGRKVILDPPKWCVIPFAIGAVLLGFAVRLDFWALYVIGAALTVASFMRAYDERASYVEFEATGELDVFGTANVTVRTADTFPRSTVKYPDALGQPVVIRTVNLRDVDYGE